MATFHSFFAIVLPVSSLGRPKHGRPKNLSILFTVNATCQQKKKGGLFEFAPPFQLNPIEVCFPERHCSIAKSIAFFGSYFIQDLILRPS
jgi:hypothetical protein